MKVAVAVLGAFALATCEAANVGPIQKVIEMIGALQAKVIKEGEAAQVTYDKYAEWCEDESKELHFQIKTGKAQVKDLKSTIEQEDSKIAAFENKIDELSGTISSDEADLKEATAIREKENKAFVAEEKELLDVVDTIQRAVGILEKQAAEGGASMLQLQSAGNLVKALSTLVQASAFSSADAAKLTALVQAGSDSDDEAPGAPDAAAYKNKSGGIIEVLGDMLEKAQGQLDALRKKETASLNDFQLLKQSLDDKIKYAKQDMAKVKKGMAAASEKKSDAEGELGATTKELKEDESLLNEIHHDCMVHASEFEENTKSRDEELAALAKAKQIIVEATSLEQTSFLQRSSSHMDAQLHVLRFVRDLSVKQKSMNLAQLAARISSAATLSSHSQEDVFGKVKGLITDMIAKLEAEAEKDATKKAYCDKEMGETQEKVDDKTTEIESLTTKIEQMTSRQAQLKEQVAELERAMGVITKSQATMDKLRGEENAQYKEDRAETEKGLKGIRAALKVLRDYYAKDASHGSSGGAASGIIGLLEVAESDLSKALSLIIGTEEESKRAYESETKENEVDMAAKEADVKYKKKEMAELAKSTAESKGDLSGVESELAAVNEYFAKIKGECIEKPETYEERKARRDQEIAGLKEALDILSSDASLLQEGSSRVVQVAPHVQI